ncbi:amylo-alpha-1,6-glucosidase [Aromatoleum buckelii]|uniref:Glycogen debranching protein n=1 Tax=Aromatoleum buckelii TaxID=200254 RepID=A0ABX1N6W0_9RHOO|nr:amylo-alpha-1,6-glucosidase [Aromatoleum buckelii]MCK0511299.1 amylo-alpha-1,6-glucosidase [Aromatoleum buckelii]
MIPPRPLVPLVLPWKPGDDPAALREREWLVTNGMGGFASGSLLGMPTRRYHGLFVPNLSEPKGRYVALSRLDELIETSAGPVNLGGAEFIDGTRKGVAERHLREFRLDGLTPVWVFDIDGSIVERSIVMPHGRNAVCVRWRLLDGPARRMRVRLYVGPRRQDAALVCDDARPCELERATAQDGGQVLRIRQPTRDIVLRVAVRPDNSAFVEDWQIDREVLFRVERDRGYDRVEHMHSPGGWSFELRQECEAALFATTDAELPALDAGTWFDAERGRLEALLARGGFDEADGIAQRLALAADQFIVLPGSRRDEPPGGSAGESAFRSVIAGYHWFNDWGRDTMISLEGLTLCTGRLDEARAILRTFAGYLRDGLLPNLFPEGGREALYHTVDATLWYFHALERYVLRTRDIALVGELYPALQDVVAHHLRGTRFGIGVDPRDGLLQAGAEGYQLTWMDAKVDDWVVTPRRGKPVEIQALWYNALRLMAGWARLLGVADDGCDALADRVQAAFNARFWSSGRGHLFDVIDGPAGDDASLRPNQIFALSLTHPVLDRDRWDDVLAAVERALLTPVGLRTLAPGEPGYQARYEGSLRERDAAYHQGTVWPWLLGHFVDARIRVRGRTGAREFLQAFPAQLLEAGIGSLSEVYGAEPPHRAGGCIAQAWSVAEVLRAWLVTRERRKADG